MYLFITKRTLLIICQTNVQTQQQQTMQAYSTYHVASEVSNEKLYFRQHCNAKMSRKLTCMHNCFSTVNIKINTFFTFKLFPVTYHMSQISICLSKLLKSVDSWKSFLDVLKRSVSYARTARKMLKNTTVKNESFVIL